MTIPELGTAESAALQAVVERSARDLETHVMRCVPCRTPGVSCGTVADIQAAHTHAAHAQAHRMTAVQELEKREVTAWREFLDHSRDCTACPTTYTYCSTAAALLTNVRELRDAIGWGPR